MKHEQDNNIPINLVLTVDPDQTQLFSILLRQGFSLEIRMGSSVRDLLCLQIGVSADYLDQRIQTIFLNGKVVDDVNTAVIRQGSTLALSAAMPGLAGATLRRGGAYAAMRSQISHKNNTSGGSAENGTVIIKLFNLVAMELGPMFLEQGIRVDGKNMEIFFQKVPDLFWDGCRAAEIDGISRKVRDMALVEWKNRQVFLKLKIEK